jgi:integrase
LALATLDETRTSAGLTGNQTQDGYIIDFAWKMKKRNKAASTIAIRTLYLSRLVKLGADLRNPDSVETVIATEEMPTASKYNAVKAYVAFTKAYKIEWEPIEVHYEPKEPFYPQEEEIDLLINSCSKVTSTFLQVAKDTGARIGEIRKIQWTDINEKNHTIAINHPEKGSKARTVKVTEKTLAMAKNLKKNHGDYLFNPTFTSQRKTFNKTREKMALITNNPRLLKIHFHTCRHWRASHEFERTGDIYEVKKLLGHKCISNTDRYQHGSYSNAEYVTKRPQTNQEEDELINAGFEFIRYDHKQDVPVYRRRK